MAEAACRLELIDDPYFPGVESTEFSLLKWCCHLGSPVLRIRDLTKDI
jgi:hypothetical protein